MKIDPYKYIEQDKKLWLVRPGDAGVYNKDGMQYASDGNILVRIRQDYPKKQEGKLIGTDGEVVKKFNYDGSKMEEPAKPLNYESVIPSNKTIANEYIEYRIDIGSLEEIAKKASGKSRKTELFDKKVSFINNNTGREIGSFNPKYIRKVVDFMRWLGLHRIMLHKELLSRPLIVTDGIDTLMLMPILDYNKSEIRYSVSPSEERKRTQKSNNMNRKRTKSKESRKTSTIKSASRILKEQKLDYQKIFCSEVRKASNPKQGAKNAGRIYRDRYGATAEARWKRAIKRAK